MCIIIYIHIYIHIYYLHIYIHIYYTCVYIHIYTYIFIHIYIIHIYIYIYIYIHTGFAVDIGLVSGNSLPNESCFGNMFLKHIQVKKLER